MSENDGSEGRVDEVRRRRNDDVAVSAGAGMSRRQEQILAALAGVVAARPDIDERHLPTINRAAEQGDFAACGRDLENHWPAAQIEHGEHVGRLIVGGQEFVPRFQRLREVHDLVKVRTNSREALSDAHHRHRRHAPDRRFDSATFDGAARKVVGG